MLRSDLESVLVELFIGIFGIKDFEVRSSSLQDTINIFLKSETLSQHDEGSSEKSMSFEHFRSWCTHLPSARKLLGSLLMPLDLDIFFIEACFLPFSVGQWLLYVVNKYDLSKRELYSLREILAKYMK